METDSESDECDGLGGFFANISRCFLSCSESGGVKLLCAVGIGCWREAADAGALLPVRRTVCFQRAIRDRGKFTLLCKVEMMGIGRIANFGALTNLEFKGHFHLQVVQQSKVW